MILNLNIWFYNKTESYNLNPKLNDLMRKKSVRWYCDKEIDRKLIYDAIEMQA